MFRPNGTISVSPLNHDQLAVGSPFSRQPTVFWTFPLSASNNNGSSGDNNCLVPLKPVIARSLAVRRSFRHLKYLKLLSYFSPQKNGEK
jgi:hypothetical protein